MHTNGRRNGFDATMNPSGAPALRKIAGRRRRARAGQPAGEKRQPKHQAGAGDVSVVLAGLLLGVLMARRRRPSTTATTFHGLSLTLETPSKPARKPSTERIASWHPEEGI